MRKGIFAMAFVAMLGAGTLVGCDDDGDSSKTDGAAGGIVIPDGGTAGKGGSGGSVAGSGGGLDGGAAGSGGSVGTVDAGDGGSTDGGPSAFVCEPGTAATNTAALNSTPAVGTESLDKAPTLPGPGYPNLPAL